MPSYINITCDPINPRTVRDHTARGILDALVSGKAVSGDDVNMAILRAGGSIPSKAWARKALANCGYPITVEGRHPAMWRMATNGAQVRIYRTHVIREAFSRHISFCRSIAPLVTQMPNDLVLQDSWRYATHTTISLGTDPAVGMSVRECIDAMDVLVP